MRTSEYLQVVAWGIGLFFLIIICTPTLLSAQGSIFGEVTNSDGGTPDSIRFFGYVNDTDEEIRLESSVGAGYDAGNWYDDFQNYLTEGPGKPYDYHFYNPANGQGFILSKLIPINSFQQEDISLSPVSWPQAPAGLVGQASSFTETIISWNLVPYLTWHVYRREGTSEGSFFRIDDPTGSPSNPGVTDNFFVDNTIDSGGVYDYVVIAQNEAGILGPHSDIITVDAANPAFLRGDSNGDDFVDHGDAVFTINFIFKDGPSPVPYLAGDANCDDFVDVGDVVYTINYVWKEGPPPICK